MLLIFIQLQKEFQLFESEIQNKIDSVLKIICTKKNTFLFELVDIWSYWKHCYGILIKDRSLVLCLSSGLFRQGLLIRHLVWLVATRVFCTVGQEERKTRDCFFSSVPWTSRHKKTLKSVGQLCRGQHRYRRCQSGRLLCSWQPRKNCTFSS